MSSTKPQQFFLKTAPLPGHPPDSPYTNLYIRLHGSGINSVVLTPSPPKFIKAHLEEQIADRGTNGGGGGDKRNIIAFTSSSHPDRRWGLTLNVDGAQPVNWERVEIVENGGTAGFVFEKNTAEDGAERLVVQADNTEAAGIWDGWMVCEWASGHPQLFWTTRKLLRGGDLPSFCHRVQVVREMLSLETDD